MDEPHEDPREDKSGNEPTNVGKESYASPCPSTTKNGETSIDQLQHKPQA
jgi:hypothetical protein